MTNNWVCVSLSVKKAEIDISHKKKVSSFPRGTVRMSFLDLLSKLLKDEQAAHIIRSLNTKGRMGHVCDSHTSAYFGGGTHRVQYTFMKNNVFPTKDSVTPRVIGVSSEGLTTTVNGIKLRASLDMTVVITLIEGSDIDGLLKDTPEWFCGEIPGDMGSMTATVKQSL